MKLREQITASTNKVEVYNDFFKCCRYYYDLCQLKNESYHFLSQDLETLSI